MENRGAIAKEDHLTKNPMMCGLLIYRFRVMLQDYCQAFANASFSVFYAVHLYHAVKQEGLLHLAIDYHAIRYLRISCWIWSQI